MNKRLFSALRLSLRARLFAGTLLGMTVALVTAGYVLTGFFSRYATKEFENSIQIQLNQLTANFEVDAEGKPVLTRQMSDPRFAQPLSGLYWQINDAKQIGVARSRSLWDDVIEVPRDAISKDQTGKPSTAGGGLHIHRAVGPSKTLILVVERNLKLQDHPNEAWQLLVAADTHELEHSIREWTRQLVVFLVILFLTLTFAALAQVIIGLAPLRSLQKALAKLHSAPLKRLEGNFPQEVQPLINDFNTVLDHSVQVVNRARAQTGDLAHSLKTPLAVLSNAASSTHASGHDDLARLVKEQTAIMQRHIDWRLQRARTAATAGMPNTTTLVQPSLEQLIRVMQRVHADQNLIFKLDCSSPNLTFKGENQDFQEMMGNILDNASKWAKSQVQVTTTTNEQQIQITVDDDGPGLKPDQYDKVLLRGIRIDEVTPGTGLGLAIVKELVELYDGRINLAASPSGGLRVILTL